MVSVVWPEVEVNGVKLVGGGDNGVEVTPEFFASWLEESPRPEGYSEGQVFIKLTYTEISRLFGDVTITYSREDK